MADEVRSEPDNKLLNVDTSQYIDYLVDRYKVTPLELHWDQMTVSQIERQIPAEQHSFLYNVMPGRSYPRQVIVYRIPYSGSRTLLGLKPSQWLMSGDHITVDTNSISFEVIIFSQDAEAIKRVANHITENLKRQVGNSSVDVAEFNNSLPGDASNLVNSRKTELLKRLDVLHNLGVPVEKADHVPETFAVDAPRKTVIVKPQAPDTTFSPEPVLDDSSYEEILKVIHHVGVEMERHPSIYEGKDEESLRDFLLMVLSPNFHSTSGETFNKSGKTDILIRHENSNAFVAECAIWAGEKKYQEKLSQALGYLTWRDSKAAVVLFVRNKNLQPVFDVIERSTPEHPCWTHTDHATGEGSSRYRFHLPDDETRGLKLAVLAFHIPPVAAHAPN